MRSWPYSATLASRKTDIEQLVGQLKQIEGDNLLSHGLTQIRNFYDPYRDVPGGGALSSIDGRYPRFGPELSLRLRKTFG